MFTRTSTRRRRFFHQYRPIERTAIMDAPDRGLTLKHVFVLLVVIPLLGAAVYAAIRVAGTIQMNHEMGPAYESR